MQTGELETATALQKALLLAGFSDIAINTVSTSPAHSRVVVSIRGPSFSSTASQSSMLPCWCFATVEISSVPSSSSSHVSVPTPMMPQQGLLLWLRLTPICALPADIHSFSNPSHACAGDRQEACMGDRGKDGAAVQGGHCAGKQRGACKEERMEYST